MSKLRFIILGDSKGKEDGINKKVLNKILSQVKSLKIQPNYIIHLGDSVAGSGDIESLKFQMDGLLRLIRNYYPVDKVFPIVGNHEVNNVPINDEAEKIFKEYYSSLKADNYLEGYNNTVYYKDFNSVRCIFLNTFHYGELHKITGKQLEWFKKVSKEDMLFKIVFLHSPAFPTGAHFKTSLDAHLEERDAFWKIVEENNINLVFSGHEHNYSRRERYLYHKKNIITQVITGGAGEKLRDGYKSKDGVIIPPKAVHHYVILDIEDNNIRAIAVSIKGKILDDFVIGVRYIK